MFAEARKDLSVHDVGYGDHVCLAFADDGEQRDILTAYLADGLRQGERVLYLADTRPAEAILDWLTEAGVDPRPMLSRGQLLLTTAQEGYLASGSFDPDTMVTILHQEVAESLAAGYTGFRVSGEMDWALRGVPGADRLAEYETKVNSVFTGRRASALCQYDARRFPSGHLHALGQCHPSAAELPPLHSDAKLRLVPAFRYGLRALRVVGTVDYQSTHVLAAALDTALGWPGDLYVDMEELEFIDLAGVRALAHAAARLTGGRRMHVGNLAPLLCQVINLAGFDDIPALTVTAAEVPE